MRWPFGPPHLALDPPYLFFFWGGGIVCFCWCFFGGLGSGEVARRATSLGPKPSLFIYFFFLGGLFCPFVSLLVIQKTVFFPLERAFFCLFLSLSLCFSFAFFWPPPFSISRSLSLSCSFIVFSFFLFFSFLLVPSFCFFFPFVSSLLLFHERNNIKTFNCNSFFSSIFFSLVSCLVFFSKPFSYLCLSPDFKYVFST